jgi:ketosteroid isomerase-like protein
MSEENVDLVRRAYDAFNRRRLGAFLALAGDDVEVNSRLAAIEGGYHGHDGVRRWWKDLFDVMPDYRVEVEELIDLGDHVLARTRHHGRGKGSGVEVEQQMIFQLWTLRHDRIVRAEMYYDKAEALEAAGLRE